MNIQKYRHKHLWLAALGVILGFSSVSRAAEYKIHKLANGITVLTAPRDDVPLAYINVTFYGGASVGVKETDGLIHYLEHIILKANALAPTPELTQNKRAQLGLNSNGTTGDNHMDYFGWFPAVFLDEVTEFYAAIAQAPMINPRDIDNERTIIFDEYDRVAFSPSFKSYFTNNYIMSKGNPHSSSAIGFTKAAIQSADAALLWKVYDQIVAPSNTTITLVGSITHTQGLKVVKRYFGDWQDPSKFTPVQAPANPNYFTQTERYNFSHPKFSNAHISLRFRGPNPKLDMAEYATAVMLGELLYHKDNTFYKTYIKSGRLISGGVWTDAKEYLPQIYYYGSTQAKAVDQVIEDMRAEIGKWLTDDYFTSSQLKDVIRREVVWLKKRQDDFTKYAELLTYYTRKVGPEFLSTAVQRYNQVTIKDIHNYIRKYISNQPHKVYVNYHPDDAKELGITLNGDDFFAQNILPIVNSQVPDQEAGEGNTQDN